MCSTSPSSTGRMRTRCSLPRLTCCASATTCARASPRRGAGRPSRRPCRVSCRQRSRTDPGSGPAGSTVTVSGTGWDPAYYTNGVEISFYQNFGNGVLTSYADRMYVNPDAKWRFHFETVIPSSLRTNDVVTISRAHRQRRRRTRELHGDRRRPDDRWRGNRAGRSRPDGHPVRPQPGTGRGRRSPSILGSRTPVAQGAGVFNIKWFVDGREVGAYASQRRRRQGRTEVSGRQQSSSSGRSTGREPTR